MLHESAKVSSKVPPQGSSWALSTTLAPVSGEGLVEVTTSKTSSSLTLSSSSAAVVVTTLKVEPGGCGAE